jgi:hypothetical protein
LTIRLKFLKQWLYTKPLVNEHLQNIFKDKELDENSVIRKFRITANDGKSYDTRHYGLQAIIAVGFKVGNQRAVQFRKLANKIVKDYAIQGWAMDAERLKNNGTILTAEYFERQLEKIREIRISERRFYQKIINDFLFMFFLSSQLSPKFPFALAKGWRCVCRKAENTIAPG